MKTNTPETYYDYFRANNITGVVRFNNKVYDRKKFLDAGFNHYDLYFADGGNPTDAILKKFLDIAESEKGALAVHCKAGPRPYGHTDLALPDEALFVHHYRDHLVAAALPSGQRHRPAAELFAGDGEAHAPRG